MEKYFLIFDTNIWIYLANGYDPRDGHYHDGPHYKMLDALKRLVEEDRVVILTTQIIKDEWIKNKERTRALIDSYKAKIKTNEANLKHFKNFVDENDKSTLDAIHQRLVQNIERIITNNEDHITKVENLLIDNTEVIEIDDNVKLQAVDLSLNKLAPFKGAKSNSMADALILLSGVSYLKQLAKSWSIFDKEDLLDYPNSYFVTGNKGDFSNPNHVTVPHIDLKTIFDSAELKYRIHLAELINELEAAVLETDEVERLSRLQDEFEDGMYYCEVCNPDDEHILLNFINFHSSIEIERTSNYISYNPNQLNIFSEPEYQQAEPANYESETIHTDTGQCAYCGTDHIKCVSCQSAIALPDDRHTVDFECDGCGCSYQINHTYIGSGEYEISINFVG